MKFMVCCNHVSVGDVCEKCQQTKGRKVELPQLGHRELVVNDLIKSGLSLKQSYRVYDLAAVWGLHPKDRAIAKALIEQGEYHYFGVINDLMFPDELLENEDSFTLGNWHVCPDEGEEVHIFVIRKEVVLNKLIGYDSENINDCDGDDDNVTDYDIPSEMEIAKDIIHKAIYEWEHQGQLSFRL
ncbi:MAG TPA: hypothetical protein VK203_10835 [Nostocaceae cyanobacterium]|nr:hypothetical protein [Nostocaceae cyanobacterium]